MTPPLCAFDLLEMDGADLRHVPIEERKDTLAKLLM
jgi:ATP-dependent DNA ligase